MTLSQAAETHGKGWRHLSHTQTFTVYGLSRIVHVSRFTNEVQQDSSVTIYVRDMD